MNKLDTIIALSIAAFLAAFLCLLWYVSPLGRAVMEGMGV